jgi:hypothetical protein
MTAQISSSFAPLSYACYSRLASGRVSMPVSPSEVIYASFEHVSGVAAPEGSGALSVDRLKILDILIDQLSNIRKEPIAALSAPNNLSPQRVDALIEQYGKELHAKAAAGTGPYVPRVAAEPGMLFSFAA